MKTFKKALPILGVLFWALLLAPFFFGAQAAHPATDDFTFAVYTHPTWVQTGSVAARAQGRAQLCPCARGATGREP
ncbi:MAG: hypothetical protein ACLUHE_09100 [Christensenellales bacterium]